MSQETASYWQSPSSREKNLQKLRSQIHGRGLRQARRGGSLHPAQSHDRQIHHILPLYRQVTVIWSWYKKSNRAVRVGICAATENYIFHISPSITSEIRLVCSRDRGLLSWEPLGVFGANMFRPFNQWAAIRYGRRPGHVKAPSS